MTTWPNLEIDRIAASQALEEMGEDCPLSQVLARAQAIKDEMLKTPTPSEWDRFLHNGAPDEYDHDREAEEE